MTVLPTFSSSSSPAVTATSHSNSNGVNGINGTLKPHSEHSFTTRSIHVGSEPQFSSSSGVSTPLDLSTTYAQSSVGIHKGFEYSRSSNPTRLALERLIASLEGADQGLKRELGDAADEWVRENGPAALAFASGSAATATVVQALVGNKGHIVSVGSSTVSFSSRSHCLDLHTPLGLCAYEPYEMQAMFMAVPRATCSKLLDRCKKPRRPLST